MFWFHLDVRLRTVNERFGLQHPFFRFHDPADMILDAEEMKVRSLGIEYYPSTLIHIAQGIPALMPVNQLHLVASQNSKIRRILLHDDDNEIAASSAAALRLLRGGF